MSASQFPASSCLYCHKSDVPLVLIAESEDESLWFKLCRPCKKDWKRIERSGLKALEEDLSEIAPDQWSDDEDERL